MNVCDMSEYEEITNGKTVEELEKELQYQLVDLGYNITDSFPQHIINCITNLKRKVTPVYPIVTIEFVGIDDWNRPIFKNTDSKHYYGSTMILFPYETSVKEVLETITIKDLTYFGTSFGCEPLGSPLRDDIDFQIVNT